jgi:hypothetical protein
MTQIHTQTHTYTNTNTNTNTNTKTEMFWAEMFKKAIETRPEIMQLLDATREDEYWEALKVKNMNILNNDEYLVKNAFEFNDLEQPELRTLFKYFKNIPEIFVAGGYPTLQFLNKNLNEFPNSDIDVFILNNKNNISDIVKELVDFLDTNFGISEIYSYTDVQAGVFSIKCNKLKRTVQIIGTQSNSISEIFNSFDSSHCKCGVYLGETYVTFDALYAKKTNTAMFYRKYPKEKRIYKAFGLGLKIFGYDYVKICNNKLKTNKNMLPLEKINDIKHGTITEDNFKFRRTKEGMLRDFTPVKRWTSQYDNMMFNKVYDPIQYYDSTGVEKYVSLIDYNSLFENYTKETFNFPGKEDLEKIKTMPINYSYRMNIIYPNKYYMLPTEQFEMTHGGLPEIDKFHPYDVNCCKFFIPLGNANNKKNLADVGLDIKKIVEENFNLVFPNEEIVLSGIFRTSVIGEEWYRTKVTIPHEYDYNTKSLKLNIDLVRKSGEKLHITDMNELRKEFKKGCTAKFELFVNKFWMQHPRHVRGEKMRYCGYTLMCKTIIIVE